MNFDWRIHLVSVLVLSAPASAQMSALEAWVEETRREVKVPALYPLPQRAYCGDLRPGDAPVLVNTPPIETTGLRQGYVLQRLPDRAGNAVHQITLNIEFSPENAGLPPPAELRKRTAHCLAVSSLALRGPNLEYLTLRLAAEKDRRLDPILRKVTYTDRAVRGHSELWRVDFDCQTILHETLHLLGLVDGYEEKDPKLGYDCRRLEPRDSVMSDQWAAFSKAAKGFESTYFPICTCSGTTRDFPACYRRLEQLALPVSECPAGTWRFDGEAYNDWDLLLDGERTRLRDRFSQEVSGVRQRFVESGDVVKLRLKKRAPPKELDPRRFGMLYPFQYEVLIHPGCRNTAGLYLECAVNAYRTKVVCEKPESGGGCLKGTSRLDADGCIRVSESCDRPERVVGLER